jgi:hypothetical protein
MADGRWPPARPAAAPAGQKTEDRRQTGGRGERLPSSFLLPSQGALKKEKKNTDVYLANSH